MNYQVNFCPAIGNNEVNLCLLPTASSVVPVGSYLKLHSVAQVCVCLYC